MQIWNGCNALNIVGNPIKISIQNLHFWVQDQKLKDDWTPCFWLTRISPKIFQFRFSLGMVKNDWPPFWLTRISPKISQFRFSLDMVKDDWPPSQFWHLVEMWEILLLHVLSNDACKCAITFSPSAESHLKMLIYYIFSCKCRFEMAVMQLILQETP